MRVSKLVGMEKVFITNPTTPKSPYRVVVVVVIYHSYMRYFCQQGTPRGFRGVFVATHRPASCVCVWGGDGVLSDLVRIPLHSHIPIIVGPHDMRMCLRRHQRQNTHDPREHILHVHL